MAALNIREKMYIQILHQILGRTRPKTMKLHQPPISSLLIRRTICTKGTFGFFTMITSYHTLPLYFARTIVLNKLDCYILRILNNINHYIQRILNGSNHHIQRISNGLNHYIWRISNGSNHHIQRISNILKYLMSCRYSDLTI